MSKYICKHCNTNSILRVHGKCSDMCTVQLGTFIDHQGYVPRGLGIGGGDYIDISFCTQCGMKHDFSFLTQKELLEILSPTEEGEDDEE